MIRQLAFDLPATEALRRADFFVSPANALALAAIDGWQGWPGGKMLLIGPEGAGKTHLAHVWAEATGATVIAAAALARADVPALAARGAVCVENADHLSLWPAAQVALFHLHNLLLPAGRLMVTAAGPVRDWGPLLPDLASRMAAAPVTRLDPPDDALLTAVLAKLFADRQLVVAPALLPYLVARMDRSVGAARALVARLDALSLALGRPVTRQLAADVLGEETEADQLTEVGPA